MIDAKFDIFLIKTTIPQKIHFSSKKIARKTHDSSKPAILINIYTFFGKLLNIVENIYSGILIERHPISTNFSLNI